jgi:ParB-like chromosome segregation protein Spo0J
MVETRVFTKSEYVNLIARVSTSDYESLKQSIKEHGGLLMPIILNQDKVVLDGHNRLRACIELGFPVSYSIKDFTGRPLDELKYVVTVNLQRRHLDEFQRAEIAIKFDKLYRKIARERYEATLFSSEAASKRHKEDTEDFSSSLRLASGDASGITPAISPATSEQQQQNQELSMKSSQELANEFGVSSSTIERVRTILEQATPEQIQGLRNRTETGEGPGVRTVFERVQTEKLKSKLQTDGPAQELRRDNLRLINKDFRTISHDDIPDESVDLVLVLDFPEPRIREDEGFRVYAQLMQAGCGWLKDGGILAMRVQQPLSTKSHLRKATTLTVLSHSFD